MLFTIKELENYQSIKNLENLTTQSKKDKKLLAVLRAFNEKIKERKNADYSNMNSQSQVINKIFVITSRKHTANKIFVDSFEMIATEVRKLQQMKLSYQQFKNLFTFVSKFILCNHSVKYNLANHERFYSQCLAQINLVLNKFTKEVIHSRSKNKIIKAITLKNVEQKCSEFNKLLFDKKLITIVKAKSKTAKLLKSKKLIKV